MEKTAIERLSKARVNTAIVYSILMLISYFGFIGLVAYNKPLLNTMLGAGLTFGILLGALVIASAWLLTFFYVRWANSSYDSKVAEIRKSMGA